MSAHRYLSITCDGSGGNHACSTPEYFAGLREDVNTARKFLRSIGWQYVAHPEA